MTWHRDAPQGYESDKIKYLIVPFTKGCGLDVGCGGHKPFRHFLGVDNMHHHQEFGWTGGRPDILVKSAEDLRIFSTGALDFVFSSHLLEHLVDTRKVLKEWWRVIRPGGHLVLYLPHKDLYPNIGQPGANPDHKHDFLPADIIGHMEHLGDWDLVWNETRDEGNEYSFLQVYRKTTNGKQTRSCDAKPPTRTACIVRYGGIGDILQASTLAPNLKAQGYHVTMMTDAKGRILLNGNPHIDDWLVQDTEQVPNAELGPYWTAWAKRFDKFINLCEVVEGGLLAMPGRIQHTWPLETRQQVLGTVNYYERMADIAGVPHKFAPSFFPSDEEKDWARKQRAAIPGKRIVLWSLSGSSIHKTYPWTDAVVDQLLHDPDVTVITVGDDKCRLLEEGIFENILYKRGAPRKLVEEAEAQDGLAGLESLALQHFGKVRIIPQSGKWAIRQVLAFLEQVDVVVGPETGILSGAAFLPCAKIVMMSHSSPENLTKHWKNTTAVMAGVGCQPCHMMHYGRDHCPEHKETGASLCMGYLDPAAIYECIQQRMPKVILHAVK